MSLEAKLTSDIRAAIKKLQPLEKISRLAAHDALMQTGREVRKRGAHLAKQTRYAPKLGIRDIEASSMIYNKGSKMGLAYAAETQEVLVRFAGRAIPIVKFDPKEYEVGHHPIFGTLWATDITMYGKKVKTHAFHLKGNVQRNAKYNGINTREDLNRGGWGGNPGTPGRNSKLFYRKGRESLPIKRFITHSVGSLMASAPGNIEGKLHDFGMRALEIHFDYYLIRRFEAHLRGR